MADDTTPVLQLDGLRKSYNVGKPTEIEVLHGIDLQLARGDFACLIGQSGSGKSTLLNLLGLLDTPTAGELTLMGQPTAQMDDAGRTALRGRDIGFVFQFHHLIPAFSALENVLMPLMVARGRPSAQDTGQARALLDAVGLGNLTDRKPDQLSGASSSVWPWPVPWSPALPCCWPTSPPATWTAAAPKRCSPCSGASTRTSAVRCCWSPTTRALPRSATARSPWPMAASWMTACARTEPQRQSCTSACGLRMLRSLPLRPCQRARAAAP